MTSQQWWSTYKKERKKWTQILRIMGRVGAKAQVLEDLFQAVIKAFIIFWFETWVMIPHTGKIMGGLQHRVDRQLMRKKLRQLQDKSWE